MIVMQCFTCTVIFCFFFINIYAYDNQENHHHPLALETLVHKVLQKNPDLAAAEDRIRAAKIAVPRVQVYPDPSLKIMTHARPIKKSNIFRPRIRYELSQTIPFPGKLRQRGRIAEKTLETVQNNKNTICLELSLQAKRLYYQLLLNYIAQRINRNNHSIITRFINGALALYKTGKGIQANVLKGHVELQILDEDLLKLQSEQATIESTINALLDKPPTTSIDQPEEKFSNRINLNYERLQKIALKNRPELHGMQAMVEEQKRISRLARLEFFPDITLSGRYEKLTRSPHDNSWGIAINFKIPLWYGKREKRESQEAEARALAHKNSWYALRAIIRSQIKELLAKINSAEERIILYKKGLIPKTIEALASFESEYRVGKGGFLILLDTRRQLQNFQLKYAQVRIEREILLAELERAIGKSLQDIQGSDSFDKLQLKNHPDPKQHTKKQGATLCPIIT